jgi:tetratricopeptide (TPR) repeat protein
MAKDQMGLPLTGADASARAYDRAVSDYWGLTGDPVGALREALAEDPAFALGAAAIAGLFLIGGFRGDHPEVVTALAAAERAFAGASPREHMHVAAVEAWAEGRSTDAARIWETILVDEPADALALRFLQDAYFFLGQSLAIRDSVARVLPAWDRGHPLTSFVLGAYAFGLEEAGDLGRAEETARQALALNPKDAWATHALAHVFEMACRVDEGIAFLESTRAAWSPAHFIAGHNGWHLALFLIDEGRFEEVLAGHDRFVAPKLAGVDVGDRWAPVARAWAAHADDHVLAFNDLHAALAAARSPDPDDAKRLRRSLDAYARDGRGHNQKVTAEVGRRLIEGVLHFGAGADREAIEAILPVRYEALRIGGSHAQRDLVNLTLIAAAERSGEWRLARALLAERAAQRPTAKVRAQYERARANTAGPGR